MRQLYMGLKYTPFTKQKGGTMDIIKEYFKKFTDKDWDKVYLREIALLMEQMDELRGELMVKENLLKNYEKQVGKVKGE